MSKKRRYLDDGNPIVLKVNSEGIPHTTLSDVAVSASRLPEAKATDENINRYAQAVAEGKLKLTQIPDTELRNKVRAKPIVDQIIKDRDKTAGPIAAATIGMPALIIGGISATPTAVAAMNNPIVNAGLTVHGAINAPKNIKEGVQELQEGNYGRGALDLGLTALDLYGAGNLLHNFRFRVPRNSSRYYRIVDKRAIDDYISSGKIRSAAAAKDAGTNTGDNLKGNAGKFLLAKNHDYVMFSKGKPWEGGLAVRDKGKPYILRSKKNTGSTIWEQSNIDFKHKGHEGIYRPRYNGSLDDTPSGFFEYWEPYKLGYMRRNINRHSLKHGGIYIQPSHRGRFTALKERTGHSTSWFKEHGTPAEKKMAVFADNAKHWNH